MSEIETGIKSGKIEVEIEGTSPLLMNKFHVEAMETKVKVGSNEANTYGTAEAQAEKTAYWASEGKKELIIPAEVIKGAMVRASTAYKTTGRRGSVMSAIAGTLRITPFEIPLGTSKFEIDSRGVVIQSGAKRNRIVRHRAKLTKWKAKFNFVYDKRFIQDGELLKTILVDAGQRIGIMDYRPSNKGYFGTFVVTKFKEIE